MNRWRILVGAATRQQFQSLLIVSAAIFQCRHHTLDRSACCFHKKGNQSAVVNRVIHHLASVVVTEDSVSVIFNSCITHYRICLLLLLLRVLRLLDENTRCCLIPSRSICNCDETLAPRRRVSNARALVMQRNVKMKLLLMVIMPGWLSQSDCFNPIFTGHWPTDRGTRGASFSPFYKVNAAVLT
jgi:hypothetical protein